MCKDVVFLGTWSNNKISSWLQAGGALNYNDTKKFFRCSSVGLHHVHVWLAAAHRMISMISNSVKHWSLSRWDEVVSYAQSYLGKATDSPLTRRWILGIFFARGFEAPFRFRTLSPIIFGNLSQQFSRLILGLCAC